jgi:hypothetical protein
VTLSVSTNFAYWRLGVAYQAFADVSLYMRHYPDLLMKPLQRRRPNFGPALHPRTEQRIFFDLLWDYPAFRLIGFGPNDTMGPQERFAAGA